MNRKKREIKPLLNEPTKGKWKQYHIDKEKAKKLDLKMSNERIARVITHNFSRKLYIMSGFPLPPHLKSEWLFTNHSRKGMKRNGKSN